MQNSHRSYQNENLKKKKEKERKVEGTFGHLHLSLDFFPRKKKKKKKKLVIDFVKIASRRHLGKAQGLSPYDIYPKPIKFFIFFKKQIHVFLKIFLEGAERVMVNGVPLPRRLQDTFDLSLYIQKPYFKKRLNLKTKNEIEIKNQKIPHKSLGVCYLRP